MTCGTPIWDTRSNDNVLINVWRVALVVACQRSHYSNTSWVSEKTGERSYVWPMPVAWRVTVVVDERVSEWILDDDDKGKSWMFAG